uniref:Uncharacterized protein n=1 Tax=Eptatretus burgeri TaxID=7764 RepID=A0A8C4QIU4_EPTBU
MNQDMASRRSSNFNFSPLHFLMLLVLLRPIAWSALVFGGEPGQWARFLRWEGASWAGRLTFQLHTNQSQGLIMYQDDGGFCDFLTLLLSEGRLQLQVGAACAESMVRSDRQVDDGRWHWVQLGRAGRQTMLSLDGETQATLVTGHGRLQITSDLFLGGIPPEVRTSSLTFPPAKYEPPFHGLILNLRCSDEDNLNVERASDKQQGDMHEVLLLSSQGINPDGERVCMERNPCENGGLCSVTDDEAFCDCSGTGFSGRYCDEEPGHLMMGDQGNRLPRSMFSHGRM